VEVDAQNVREIVVINKADAADPEVLARLLLREPHAIVVSARSGEGIEELIRLIEDELPRPAVEVSVLVPYTRGDLVSRVHRDGEVLSEEHTGEGTLLGARVLPDLAAELERYSLAPQAG
jgi:GTP-binding protein HflX